MTPRGMAERIELWPVDRLVPYARNARTHSEAQVAQIASSIVGFGFTNPILVDSGDGIIAGHGRLAAARKLKLERVPVIVLDHLSPTQKRAYILADNKLAELAGWDEELLRGELASLQECEFDLHAIGFSDSELQDLLDTESNDEEVIESPLAVEVPVVPVTQPGDLWHIGPHRLLCGDCRDVATVATLLQGKRANVVVTSPPYASQRAYDPSSGFEPVHPDAYVHWYRGVAAAIESVLAADGSYFLNIKEHAEDGQRSLYVKDLVLAHARHWRWRFVDEFCWRKTDNGVPGGWGNRFKNAWEPVFHFCRQQQIKFRPEAVSHASEACFEYDPAHPRSRSGSGLLGDLEDGVKRAGLARPSNVIEVKSESGQGAHSAPFPRALVEFFVKAFSDRGDLVFDPFLGSGTTMAAAQVLGRVGYGCEISPAYCDVILNRMRQLAPELLVTLAATGESFDSLAEPRLEVAA